jgi:hypothetical protein
MSSIGYAALITSLGLNVVHPLRPAGVSSGVNRRTETNTRILFPRGVSITDTPLGHLEFALRHEDLDLAIAAEALDKIPADDLIAAYQASPTGEYIRKLCALWEWLHDAPLPTDLRTAGRYLPLLDADAYVTSRSPSRNQKYRIEINLPGNRFFCPVIKKSPRSAADDTDSLLAEISAAMDSADPALYERAVHYLYLSETKSSFSIEKDIPDSRREDRFIRLLMRAGDKTLISEEWLVELQNAVVKDDFSKEASYRTRQNWLENAAGRVTFFPAPLAGLRETMHGLAAFANHADIDLISKAACTSFGFVYAHPFMDGNGRLHRFLIHQVLAQSGQIPEGLIVPVSAVILKNIPDYLKILSGFSAPVTDLWEYRRGDLEPLIVEAPGPYAYRFFDATRETNFLRSMIEQAIRIEMPAEIRYLSAYDQAMSRITGEFDIPHKDASMLVRSIMSNGALSKGRRKQFDRLPEAVLDRIEAISIEEAASPWGGPAARR